MVRRGVVGDLIGVEDEVDLVAHHEEEGVAPEVCVPGAETSFFAQSHPLTLSQCLED